MLVWSRWGRAGLWSLLALLVGVIYVLPLSVIALASVAGEWNGMLPRALTFANYIAVMRGDTREQLYATLVTAAAASLLALAIGAWAAISLRAIAPAPRRLLDVLFFVPSAVPSVSVGLGLLVAFSQPPVLLNGTVAIVLIAHLVIVSAFTYGVVSAGLARVAPQFEEVAASLGARPAYQLRHVTLPLIQPYLVAAFSLSFAMSMGELGATAMVYPPGWVTMPVGIFALTDRGDVFQAAALTMLLALSTLLVLVALSVLPSRAAARR